MKRASWIEPADRQIVLLGRVAFNSNHILQRRRSFGIRLAGTTHRRQHPVAREPDRVLAAAAGRCATCFLRVTFWSGWAVFRACPGCRSRWPIFILTAWGAPGLTLRRRFVCCWRDFCWGLCMALGPVADQVSLHDRRLMRDALVNLAIRWFAGHGMAEALPDQSGLTRIRQRWGSEWFRAIFARVVGDCLGRCRAPGCRAIVRH